MGVLKVIIEVVKNFAKKSSIAGLNNAANSSSHLRRVVWLALFFTLLVFTIQAFVNTVIDFTSFPVLTSINVTRKFNLPFPAITICNLNRIHCLNLIDVQLQENKKYNETPSGGNQTLIILNGLIKLTRCNEQACRSIIEFVGPVRQGSLGDYIDIALLAFAEYGCEPPPSKMTQYCYLYKSMEEEAEKSNRTDILEKSVKAWESIKCDRNFACSYVLPDDVPPPVRQQFKPLMICKGFRPTPPGKPKAKKNKFLGNAVMEEEAKFFKLYFDLPIELRKKIGHKFDSNAINIHGHEIKNRGFVLSCLYRGESCVESNASWVNINIPRYGNCYTFNSDEHPYKKLQSTSLTGTANGISMSFFLDQDNYIVSKLSEKAGIRIIIHDPKNFPLPDEDGIDLQPGTSTSIAIQKSEIRRLPKPYVSKCFSNWTQTPYKNLTKDYSIYSLAVCQKICLQLRLNEQCGCINPYITELTESNNKICNITPSASTSSDFQCFQNFIEGFDSKIDECRCHVACLEINYSHQSTISAWPSDLVWEPLAIDLGLIDTNILPLTPSLENKFRTNIQRDFTQTDIYFQTLSVKTIEQIPKYSDESFISALGGTMSLYLGIAIIMVFEVLELIVDIIGSLGGHIFGNGKKKLKTEPVSVAK